MSILRKQSVAWVAAFVMIAAAVMIGRAGADTVVATPEPGRPLNTLAPLEPDSAGIDAPEYIRDDAGVLAASTVDKINARNAALMSDMDVGIGVVTCNSGEALYNVALDYAEAMGLGSYDFIVVLDISGDNYWLVQGADLVGYFSDTDCSDYAVKYMERDFARGDYDDAVLSLTEALSEWYYNNY